jgi:hypothetical protein
MIREVLARLRSMPVRWRLLMLLAFVLTVGIFGYLGAQAVVGARQLALAKITFDYRYLMLSLLCQTVGVMLAAAVWGDMLRRLGVRLGFLFDFQVFCLSAIGRKLPGTGGYAIGRVTIYERAGAPRVPILLALLIEAVVMSMAGLLAFAFSLMMGLVQWIDVGQARYVILLGVVAAALLLAWLQPYAIEFVARQIRARTHSRGTEPLAAIPRLRFSDSLRWLTGEVVVVVLGAGVGYFLMRSINFSMQVPFSVILGPWGLAVGLGLAAMWLPTDIGFKDGFVYFAISQVANAPFAAVVALAWRFWVSILEIAFGLVSIAALGRRAVRVSEVPADI